MATDIFAGIEGGATKSTVVLMNGKGELLASSQSVGTNLWSVGFENVLKIINDVITEVKSKASLDLDKPLTGLGLSLSGVESEEMQLKLEKALNEGYPNLSKHYHVCSDTVAPLALIGDKGGSILISGTGSNCLLLNRNGNTVKCGGFGYLLGDEGSAYWIAFKAIKLFIYDSSKFRLPPNNYSTHLLNELIKEYFQINDSYDLLSIFYSDFDKSKIAQLCVKIANLANEGDELSKWIFKEAGKCLAMHIQAVYDQADQSFKESKLGLPVVCVGSVWHSWPLLKPGFISQLLKTDVADVRRLSLLKLKQCAAIGAIYLVSRKIQYNFPFSYENNYEVFFEYSKTL